MIYNMKSTKSLESAIPGLPVNLDNCEVVGRTQGQISVTF